MADIPCDKRIAIQPVEAAGGDKRTGLILRNEDGRLALSRDCCCGICWNAYITVTALREGTLYTEKLVYPIVPCLDASGNPRSCNNVGAYDYEGYTDTYYYSLSGPDQTYLNQPIPVPDGTPGAYASPAAGRPFPLYDAEPADHQLVNGSVVPGVRHDKGYVDRYQWGSEINVDGGIAGFMGVDDPDKFGQGGLSSQPLHLGHIGVDFGVVAPPAGAPPPLPGDPPPRDARVFLHIGTLVYTLFGRDECTEMRQDYGLVVEFRSICRGDGGSRPVAVREPPSACIFSTTNTDGEGNLKWLRLDKDGNPTPEALDSMATCAPPRWGWDQYMGGPVPVVRYEPTYGDCFFYAMGVDWMQLIFSAEYVDVGAGWGGVFQEDVVWTMLWPPPGWFDARAAIDYGAVPEAEYWLAHGLPTVTIGGSVFKLDAEMFAYINDGDEGERWANDWASPTRFQEMLDLPVPKTKLLLPAAAMRLWGDSMHVYGSATAVVSIVIDEWKRCGCGHSCLQHRRPVDAYQGLGAFLPEFADPMQPPVCGTRKGFAPPVNEKRGRCLQYDPAAGKCGKYGTASFDCDNCEDSVGAPIEI